MVGKRYKETGDDIFGRSRLGPRGNPSLEAITKKVLGPGTEFFARIQKPDDKVDNLFRGLLGVGFVQILACTVCALPRLANTESPQDHRPASRRTRRLPAGRT